MGENVGTKNLIDGLKKSNVGNFGVRERQNETPPKLYITDYFSQKNILKPAVFAFIQLNVESACEIVSLLGDENCLICFKDKDILRKTKEILKINAGIQSVDSFIKAAGDWVISPMFNKTGDIVKFWKIF